MQKRRCSVKYCRKAAEKNRTRCSACRKREWAKKYPVKAAYANLRTNSKRRKKPFAITLEEFEKFCYEARYIEGKGRRSTSLSIDCIVNDLGYVPGNIRPLEKGENSRKGTKYLVYDWQTREAYYLPVPNDKSNDYF